MPEEVRKSKDETKARRMDRLIEDAVDISDRFAREPIYGPTGKGYYKSAGVEGLRKDQSRLEAQQADEESR